MVCFRNYTNEEIMLGDGQTLEPYQGPKTLKPSTDVMYVLPENIYLKARNRADVTTPRMLKDGK